MTFAGCIFDAFAAKIPTEEMHEIFPKKTVFAIETAADVCYTAREQRTSFNE